MVPDTEILMRMSRSLAAWQHAYVLWERRAP
ncbi:MAG: hypothetical protein QOK19_1125 [Solirubrobacteraceae bacterium]|jgi:hypothetical protein|nr:hypothetical protein [Solirubrobacterales bacterium]MEA2215564.1 hypothetical protein [Solirubrobacteraceae bacterium]